MGADSDVQGGLSEAVKRDNVVRLAFGGRRDAFAQFCATLEEAAPAGTTAVLRGSAITGQRWKDGAAFDADGAGTSDLDVTLVGDAVIGLFIATGFYVPGVHSRPLSDEDPEIAPSLVSLRRELMAMVHRPVNIQATRQLVTTLRGDVLDQPYLTLFEKSAAAPLGLSPSGS